MANSIFVNDRRGESLNDAQHLATLLGKVFGEKRGINPASLAAFIRAKNGCLRLSVRLQPARRWSP